MSMAGPVAPTAYYDPPRPLPVPRPIWSSIEKQLDTLPSDTATVKVEKADGTLRVAAMVKTKDGWSFMGWIEKGAEDTAIGAQVTKHFGK